MNQKERENANSYKVHPNTERILKFRRNFAEILDSHKLSFDCLSIDMVHEFQRVMQDQEELDRKMGFCEELRAAIQRINPTWNFRIVPTGSSVTGLATSNSDLDVAIHIPQVACIVEEMCSGREVTAEEKLVMWREKQLDILQIVRLILQKDESIKHRINKEHGIQLVQAQIQILKILTNDGVECDISVVFDLFLSSAHNSFMIRKLAMCDDRFATLCFVVKKWADSTGVKNPKDGGFNSYALVLLVIHFLQCGTSPPILPNLIKLYEGMDFIARSEHDFPAKLDLAAPFPKPLPAFSPNNASIAQLFFEFLIYYSGFNFNENYISIKDACVYSRKSSILPDAVRNQQQKQVYIEDPFDSHNPGRTVRSIKTLKQIFETTIRKFNPNACLEDDSSSCSDSNFKFPKLNDILNMSLSNQEEEEEEEAQKEDEDADEEVKNVSVNGCNEFAEWR